MNMLDRVAGRSRKKKDTGVRTDLLLEGSNERRNRRAGARMAAAPAIPVLDQSEALSDEDAQKLQADGIDPEGTLTESGAYRRRLRRFQGRARKNQMDRGQARFVRQQREQRERKELAEILTRIAEGQAGGPAMQRNVRAALDALENREADAESREARRESRRLAHEARRAELGQSPDGRPA